MAWALTQGLQTVRSEFNETFPQRSKTSDGSVGDLAHQVGSSGHNPDRTGKAEYKDGDALDEVRAIDVDKDLNFPGVDMEKVIQHLVTRGRSGTYLPFRYIIYKGRIWRKANAWRTQVYTGANKHNEHAHFSGDWSQVADNWTGSLALRSVIPPPPKEPLEMSLEKDDKTYLDGKFADQTKLTPFITGGGTGSPVGNAVLGHGYPRRPGEDRNSLWRNLQLLQTDLDSLQSSVINGSNATAERLGRIESKLDQLIAALNPPA